MPDRQRIDSNQYRTILLAPDGIPSKVVPNDIGQIPALTNLKIQLQAETDDFAGVALHVIPHFQFPHSLR